jgi:PAS domain-containing protein
MTSGARGRAGDPAALPELIAALDWLPVASLLLTEDGSALVANEAWTDLSGVQAEDSLRRAWLDAVEPLHRALLMARLREAATSGRAGSADFRLDHKAGGRLSRWWWRLGPAGRLVLCVASLGDEIPQDDGRQAQPSAAPQPGATLGIAARLARSEESPYGGASEERRPPLAAAMISGCTAAEPK